MIRTFSEDSASELYALRQHFTAVPTIRDRFYSPPGKENYCGYYAFAAVMDFVSIDIKSVECFIVNKLLNAGHTFTHRISSNYAGLPFSIAEDWGRILKI